MSSNYLAHISDDGRVQTVYAHLTGTAEMCGSFASVFGAKDQGYCAGLLHDIGKYSDGFQKRLHGGPRVDHSTAGAFESYKNNHIPASFCIAGHHSGLPDGGSRIDLEGSTLYARLGRANRGGLPCYDFWKDEIDQ